MSSAKRNRARILTASGLKKLRERRRSQEAEENAGYKYTLERLGLTRLDSETVKNVVDCKGSDKRKIARCFESFGLTLEDSDHIPAVQASAAPSDPNFVGRDEAIADLSSIEGLTEEKLCQLGEEPGREFLASLDRLKRKLQAERIGILIDNLEPALDSAGKFMGSTSSLCGTTASAE